MLFLSDVCICRSTLVCLCYVGIALKWGSSFFQTKVQLFFCKFLYLSKMSSRFLFKIGFCID